MNNSSISVVITTFNGEKYLSKQLNSIVNQTLLPDEIIICDDISTDCTVSILNEFKKNNDGRIKIKIYINSQKKFFAKNFIDGVSFATSDIVVLSDQDDIWENNKLEVIKQIFDSNQKIKALNLSYDLIDENDNVIHNKYSIPQKNNKRLKRISWKKFIKSTNYPGMSMAIRKNLHFDSIIYLDNVNIPPHDWLYNEQASLTKGMYKYNQVLTHYRQHSSNTVGVIKNSEISSLLKNRLHSIDFYEKTHQFMLEKYKDDSKKEKFIRKLLECDSIRKENISNKKLLKIIFNYLFNFNKISFRTFAGDLILVKKLKKK